MILITAVRAGAQQVSERLAREVAGNFMNTSTGISSARTGSDLKLVYKAISSTTQTLQDTTPLLYVFNTSDSNGFVIVSAHASTVPVLAYSAEAGFDPDHIPPPIAWWIEQYEAQIRHAALNKTEPQEIRDAWLHLSRGATSPQAARQAQQVNALIRTKWNQDSYYKAFCPQNTLTGCVATTMAQIMKFWSYPTQGTGAHTYQHKVYGTLSADFGETTYAWDKMQTTLRGKNDAVATLMYQCGVSVDMNYGPAVSGAYAIAATSPITHCAEYALKTYFGYSSTLRGVQRKNYTETQWANLLRKELDAGRPVIYTGFTSQEGHTFICDGYDDKGYFHFNWGWGGTYDGYFLVDALTPKKSKEGYTEKHQVIIGIEPGQGDPAERTTGLINVFPNPASSTFSVSFQEFDGIVTSMAVTDLRGKQFCTTSVETTESLEFFTDNLSDGLYLVCFQTDRGPRTVRIVIRK